ncbi:unnamed protein product [Trypanosoma congolense IL3000]|uniref:WGS project CAEQ00000000 data, annotated contig 559 n=1 Tax=Trypanosoma congolense (strain IL3000) TaxID=1068625 RepID=F9WGV8_TRYCI|nr:unnamed protein product [Trypanosoma congolense IL3000]
MTIVGQHRCSSRKDNWVINDAPHPFHTINATSFPLMKVKNIKKEDIAQESQKASSQVSLPHQQRKSRASRHEATHRYSTSVNWQAKAKWAVAPTNTLRASGMIDHCNILQHKTVNQHRGAALSKPYLPFPADAPQLLPHWVKSLIKIQSFTTRTESAKRKKSSSNIPQLRETHPVCHIYRQQKK